MGMIKNPREIKLLRKSATITDSCIKIIEKSLREKNITEKELARRIRKNLFKHGVRESFRMIVACGERSAEIHAKPARTNNIISGVGYVDFGAKYRGYCSDITVPFVKGRIGDKERKIVDTTMKAYGVAMKHVRRGEYCWKSFEEVNKFLKKNNFEMQHSLGHGIGRKVHEWLSLVKPSKKILKKRRVIKKWSKLKNVRFEEGMVFTIEPAVYVKGFAGCRIENTILMTKRGPKNLTHTKLIRI